VPFPPPGGAAGQRRKFRKTPWFSPFRANRFVLLKSFTAGGRRHLPEQKQIRSSRKKAQKAQKEKLKFLRFLHLFVAKFQTQLSLSTRSFWR
jgi:hypothetical protein